MALALIRDPLLSERTSLRLGGTALAEVRVEDRDGFDGLGGMLDSLGGHPVVLGRGSNILAREGRLNLVLVNVAIGDTELRIKGRDEAGRTILRVHAGTPLPLLLKRLARAGLTGLEGLSGIPGSVGGAVAMNAGSFGHVMGDAIRRVRIWSGDKGLVWNDVGDVELGYRHFRIRGLDGFHLVAEVELALEPHAAGDQAEEAILAAMKEHLARKKGSQPVSAWSAGCVFKNPEGAEPAGLLLDRAGFRGRRLGGMEFSSMHANFLVNAGAGTSEQAFELIAMARQAVKERSGVSLEMEVKVWESR